MVLKSKKIKKDATTQCPICTNILHTIHSLLNISRIREAFSLDYAENNYQTFIKNRCPLCSKYFGKIPHNDFEWFIEINGKTLIFFDLFENRKDAESKGKLIVDISNRFERDEIFAVNRVSKYFALYFSNEVHFKILEILNLFGFLTRDNLVAETNIPRTTLHDNLKKLEERGIVSRFAPNQEKQGRQPTFWFSPVNFNKCFEAI